MSQNPPDDEAAGYEPVAYAPDGDAEAGPVEVPVDALSAEVLRAVIEEFITREGTDYGLDEVDLETKVTQVRAQLRRREAVIVWDPASESVTLVSRRR